MASSDQIPCTKLPPVGNKPFLLRSIAWLPLALIVAAGCWLRFEIASQESLWLDELHTGWSIKNGFAEMLSRSAQGNQAPLFFGLTWGAASIFGTSELAIRIVSVVAGSLAMVAAARLAWVWTHSRVAATIAAGLLAVDDTFIWYATEARPYALLHLLSILQIGQFLRLANELTSKQCQPLRVKFPLAFVLLSVALLYTHYTSFFLLASELVFLVLAILAARIAGAPIRGSSIGSIALTLVAIALPAIPLLWQMSQAYGRPSDWKMVASTTQFVDEQGMNLLAWFLIPITSVVIVWIFSRGHERFPFARKQLTAPEGKPQTNQLFCLTTIAAIFLLSCGLLLLLARTNTIPITLSRYMSSSIVAGPVFAAMMLGMLEKKHLAVACVIFLLTTAGLHVAANRLVVQSLRTGQIQTMRIENWPAAINTINESQSKTKHPVLLFGSVIEDAGALNNRSEKFQRYLQFPIDSVYELDQNARSIVAGPTVVPPHFDDATVEKVLRSGGAWILVRHHRFHARSIAEELLLRLADRKPKVRPVVVEHSPEDELIQLISIDLN